MGEPMARKDLIPSDVVAICDTREQIPFDLAPLQMVRGSLACGDYSIRGLEHEVVVERKGLPDLIACVGTERERFERCVQRMLAMPARLLIIEATMAQLELGQWRARITPNQVTSSLLSWSAQGLPILTVDGHATAGKMAAKFLFVAARRRWRELGAFYDSLKIAT